MDRDRILGELNAICKGTLMETLGIEYCDIGENFLVARMPVGPKVHQPDGVLHGGATLALAESVGSGACMALLPSDGSRIRGIEITGNHVASVREGFVYARAELWHKGRTTQLWHIAITDGEGRRISFCKLTTITLAS